MGPWAFTKCLKPVVAFMRRLGVRLIVYLDDMIILNQCSHQLMMDFASLRYLLENLGFLINWKKTTTTPAQEIQFLGFLIDSVQMMILLLEEKIRKLVVKCQKLVSRRVATVRKMSEILGLKTSSLQGIAPAPLHYRQLQMVQIRYLSMNKSYQAKIILTPD